MAFIFVLSHALTSAACSSSPATFTEEAATLRTATGTLSGSLLLPSAAGPHPAVLIVSGSGPTDRDGNSPLLVGANDSLRLLAEALASRGVASVRFDKRGVGESAAAAPPETELRFDTYVADAVAWMEQMQDDARFANVSIVGHSEGSLIGILGSEGSRSHAFVSIAGPARRASDVIRDQLRTQLSPALWAESDRILSELEAGRTVTVAEIPAALRTFFRPSGQPYLISWFRYVPSEELARLDLPVLIAQGTTDLQVGVSEAETLKSAKPDAELLVVQGMNHVLKRVSTDPADQEASLTDPSLPIVEELPDAIATFLR